MGEPFAHNRLLYLDEDDRRLASGIQSGDNFKAWAYLTHKAFGI